MKPTNRLPAKANMCIKFSAICLSALILGSGHSLSQEPLDPFVEQELRGVIREEISRGVDRSNPYADAPSSNPYSGSNSVFDQQVEAYREAHRQQENRRIARENQRFQAETIWRKEINLAKMLSSQGKNEEALQTAKEALLYCRKYLGKNTNEEMTNYTVLANIYIAQSEFLKAGQMKVECINVALGQPNPDYFDIGDMCAVLRNYLSKHGFDDLSQKYDKEAKRYWRIAYEGYLRSYRATIKENNKDDLEKVITLSNNLAVTAGRLGVEKSKKYWFDKKAAWEKGRK